MTRSRLIRKMLSPALYVSGAYARGWARHARRAPFTIVLVYHRVTEDGAPPPDAFAIERGTPASVFEAQMRFMLQHFVPVSASQVLAPSGQMCFAVTLDDGYEDNFRVAAPILRRLGVPATFFVVSDYVQTERLFWWEQLAQMLRATRERRIDLQPALPELAAGSDTDYLHLDTYEARWRSYERLSALLRSGAHVEIPARMMRLSSALGVHPRQDGRDYGLMSWSQLQELARQGFEIGGHTATHSNVFGAGERLLQAEIVASARAIETRIDAPVLSFAYPYGHYDRHDPTVAQLLSESGCRVAFTGHAGVVQGSPDPYLLPRATLNRPFGFACAYNVQDALSRMHVAPA